ncbi:MAG: S8 family serine peptidase, partial [Chloroflexota bacterium]
MTEHIRERIWRWSPAIFVLSFALALALLGGPGYTAPVNVHDAIPQWIAQHPGQAIPVVIQTDDPSATETQIAAVGGEFKQELGIISSVRATIPANSVNRVASFNGVDYISLDAPVRMASDPNSGSDSAIWSLVSSFPVTVKADYAWAQGTFGTGVAVAVIDTGISPSGHEDFKNTSGNSRVIAEVDLNSNTSNVTDGYGHGTHVAGIIGSNGSADGGKFAGVAPDANLVNVKISDDEGHAGIGELVGGLGWVLANKDAYNIRVVKLSLHSTAAQSYKTSPLDAAIEMLWRNGIFVVVAAGNTGPGPEAVSFPPANDPFVMTVGASDDKGTTNFGDDVMATWSSSGFTQDGFF